MTSRPLAVGLLGIPAVSLLWSCYLLFTDPSDISYECSGSTWTLLERPEQTRPAHGLFDAATHCNASAREHARRAATVLIAGLSISLIGTTTDLAVRRQAHAPAEA